MTVDDRCPVIVGAAQLTQRPLDLTDALEPVALMCEVARAAFGDAGRRAAVALAREVGVVAAVRGAWSYRDPARIVADELGASSARTAITPDGGNSPLSLLNVMATRISAGELDVAVLVGGEGVWSRRRMRTAGITRRVTRQPDAEPNEQIGPPLALASANERERGVEAPIHFYPLFESAIRHRRDEPLDHHRSRIARMWEGFNAVAVANPYAWLRKPMSAAEIRDQSPENRMVAFPYTKALCSNWDVDQAAALVVCSLGAARRAGVVEDRLVFLHAGTHAHDTPFVSNRWSLGDSPAIAAAGNRVLALSGATPGELEHVDLYSCFPSAVEAATRAIGLDEARQLTVTGGMSFAGGPLNSYSLHALATMVGVLRADPGSLGLVTANGGFLTKHAMVVCSSEPPGECFRFEDVQATVDREPVRESADSYEGQVMIEACTVTHNHEGPERGLFACLLGDGRRAWGNTEDQATMAEMVASEVVGRAARLKASGHVTLD